MITFFAIGNDRLAEVDLNLPLCLIILISQNYHLLTYYQPNLPSLSMSFYCLTCLINCINDSMCRNEIEMLHHKLYLCCSNVLFLLNTQFVRYYQHMLIQTIHTMMIFILHLSQLILDYLLLYPLFCLIKLLLLQIYK